MTYADSTQNRAIQQIPDSLLEYVRKIKKIQQLLKGDVENAIVNT